MKMKEWVKECRRLGNQCIQLEGTGNSGLFQFSSNYMVGTTQVSTPQRYYIWINDVCVRVTSNYAEAYDVWNERTAA